MADQIYNNTKNKIKIFSAEREVITDENEKLYVIFEIEENGENFLVLTDRNSIILAKELNNQLIEIEDEAIIDILLDLLDEFFENNDLVDENGNIITQTLLANEEDLN